MYHRPTLDLGTALVVFCIFFGLCIAAVLGGCTSTRPTTTGPAVGVHEYRHDKRTLHSEPYDHTPTRRK